MDVAKLRAWWWSRQGLDGSWRGRSAREVLAQAGWARSVGGSNPYFTLWSRARIGRETTDEAVATLQVHELTSARGCTYVLPSEHFGLGLALSDPFNEKGDIATGKKWLGVTEDEMERLCAAVLNALNAETLDTSEIRSRVGDAVRSLGDEGKRRGVTTTLPLGLGRLQSRGLIRRVPINGRLDQQRYRYRRWENSPTQAQTWSPEWAQRELARLYFTWIGPASWAQFQWFSGLSLSAAKASGADLDLVPIEPASELLLPRASLSEFDEFVPPIEPSYALLTSLDGLLLLRRNLLDLIDPQHRDQDVFAERGVRQLGSLQDLPFNAILDRSRLIGFWEFDSETGEIVWHTFEPASPALRDQIAETQAWIVADLGDARSFSLDSPESRRPRIQALREMRA